MEPLFLGAYAVMGGLLLGVAAVAILENKAQTEFRHTIPRAVEADGFTFISLKDSDYTHPVGVIALNQECSFEAVMVADTDAASGTVKDIVRYTVNYNNEQITVANAGQLTEEIGATNCPTR